MREMCKQNKILIAQDYLKKTLLTFAGNTDFKTLLMHKYAKIIREFYAKDI